MIGRIIEKISKSTINYLLKRQIYNLHSRDLRGNVGLTKIIMRSDLEEQTLLLENILSVSILTWRHVDLHGTYDFSNLLSANDPGYSLDDVINFKVA